LKSSPEPSHRPLRLRAFLRLAAGALACALLFAAPNDAAAQKLKQALGVRDDATNTGAASQERINKVADDTDELLRQWRDETAQIEALRVYNTQLEKLLASQDNEVTSLNDQIDSVKVIGREVTPLMLRMVDSLDEFVGLDVPFLIDERTDRVVRLRQLMDRADVTNAEKYRRIMEAYQIENDFGRTIEAYRGSLAGTGETRTVDYLRIGRVILLYQTLDGSEVGAWNQAADSWEVLDGSFRPSVRQGLRIARKQAAPDLLRLPVPAAEDAR
jgi:septal ring factor EnvC (AmiA/AmiB activator)